uniref:AIG1-type G domain-containing protein n=1 Tax=Astyanax mexicanus TaxID=7994 RepID=A0A8B9JTB5_ASTMX
RVTIPGVRKNFDSCICFTGSGKSSAAGNTILGEKKFNASMSSESVTRKCKKREVTVDGRKISVVDTPGLFDTEMTEDKLKAEIERCVELSVPGPHAFLLVIRLGVRFTEEERNAVEWIQKNFGEKASKHTIVLFTHADELKSQSIHKYIGTNKHLQKILQECGDRYHLFNNEDMENRSQVQELLDKMNIDEMVERNGGNSYTSEMFQKAQQDMFQKAEEKNRRNKIEKIKDAVLGTATAVGIGGMVAGGVVLGVTGAVLLPAAGVAAGGALAVGTGAKLIYDKVKKKNQGQTSEEAE